MSSLPYYRRILNAVLPNIPTQQMKSDLLSEIRQTFLFFSRQPNPPHPSTLSKILDEYINHINNVIYYRNTINENIERRPKTNRDLVERMSKRVGLAMPTGFSEPEK